MPPSNAPRSRRAPFARPRTTPSERPKRLTVWLVSLKSQWRMHTPWSWMVPISLSID